VENSFFGLNELIYHSCDRGVCRELIRMVGSVPDRHGIVSKTKIAVRQLSEAIILDLIRTIPLLGPQIAINRELEARISAFFKTDDEIQADLSKIMQNMAQVEEMLPGLKVHLETRRTDLQKTLKEYEKFRDLARIEKEKAQPILDELHREGNKALYIGLIINIIMIIIGFVLAHFLRIWLPWFTF
jgi:hypothetical protein